MRKHQIENAAFEVATQVRAVEDSIEAALAELAELQARMVHARGVTRADPTIDRRSSERYAKRSTMAPACRSSRA